MIAGVQLYNIQGVHMTFANTASYGQSFSLAHYLNKVSVQVTC